MSFPNICNLIFLIFILQAFRSFHYSSITAFLYNVTRILLDIVLTSTLFYSLSTILHPEISISNNLININIYLVQKFDSRLEMYRYNC